MSQPDVSVVICTYKNDALLQPALQSIFAQDVGDRFSFEIVVVVHPESLSSVEVVHAVAAGAGVSYQIVRQQLTGIGDARTRGVEAARGRWIAFFDDDQVAEPDWLDQLHRAALASGADIVGGPRDLLLGGEELAKLGPEARHLLGELHCGHELKHCRGRQIPSCGNVLVGRHVFDAVGMFDNEMTYGGEDSEFLFRARRSGFSIWTTPHAMVHHVILPYRLNPDYIDWVSHRWGCLLAYQDRKLRGTSTMLLVALARLSKSLLVVMPRYLIARGRRRVPQALDQRYWLRRTEGYVRQCLRALLPAGFKQEAFFSSAAFPRARQWEKAYRPTARAVTED
jgi:GT2 family glycosyltransferase